MKKQLKNKKKQHNLIIFSQIGLQMLIIILAGVFVGFKLDQIYPNQHKAFTILFSLLSVGFSIYFVIKQVLNSTNQDFEKKEKKQ
ncbi:MAG: AtpZ/AtpI family protein [Flavobacteriaceae bacterium]